MNNNKVNFRTIGHTVVATIEDCGLDALETFTTKYLERSTSSLSLVPNKYDEKFIMPDTFTAKAECSPEDKFDWETGKRIALDRLADKYTKSLNKHLANILIALDVSLTELDYYLVDKNF